MVFLLTSWWKAVWLWNPPTDQMLLLLRSNLEN